MFLKLEKRNKIISTRVADPEQDPDPLVRGMDPDPYQNVTDPQHCFQHIAVDDQTKVYRICAHAVILAKNYSPLDVNTLIKEIGNILSKGTF